MSEHVVTQFVPRAAGELTGPSRLGALRDLGAELVRTQWIAFLDDDNQWDAHHLHSLLATAEASASPAVHSWMRVVDQSGRPYLEPRMPWARSDEAARQEHARLVQLGVVTHGSNVYRDRADREDGEDAVRSVDGGEWLLATSFARTLGFACEFSDEEREQVVGDDDKFLSKVINAGVRIESSRQPTLIYQLGGFSNAFEQDEEICW